MDRRQFAKSAAVPLATMPLLSWAQERIVEGKHYLTVSPRQPTRDPKQVEVLEFFAYGCSHCNAFEPAIDAWQKRLPADVLFRRIPVAFREVPYVLHQKLFFAIEMLGLVEQLHRKVFIAVHNERQRLEKPEEVGDFVAKHGVNRARFLDALNSFAVATKAKQATALTAGYRIQGTPSLGIDGRWVTTGSMAGTNERSLAVAEYLVGAAKKSG
ncbi:thiol:disulfide interchange protein DsbA/DsbL [Aquabacterium sp. J223]|uniref:thiol:disulfide interchange protein DsbA/DsbL n=1 Tax=Aquabacterium sp. J223 TaxID=2898431 RepID=UPI0021AE0583|nr:thiol:disulfide interchange protein DsbA/DsbL [Aquabacterium sp. J223]UUX96631.1 thiol:disulfide interchange protein DsbA/DsbL [Aquabacterium sp. J223]